MRILSWLLLAGLLFALPAFAQADDDEDAGGPGKSVV